MSEKEDENSQKPKEMDKKKKFAVLRKQLGGGPHGVGDPNDQSLRKVEVDVLITERIREKSRKEKCKEVSTAFGKCAKDSGFFLPFKCREENRQLLECLTTWFHDEEFRKECTEEYLRERTQYRRTGIPVKKFHRGKRLPDPIPEPKTEPE